MPRIDEIRRALSAYEPALVERELERRASVALVLREASSARNERSDRIVSAQRAAGERSRASSGVDERSDRIASAQRAAGEQSRASSGVDERSDRIVSAQRAAGERSSEEERGAEILFIERAEKDGDPWSGHMAFPGGRVDLPGESPEQAAIRETLEEVGLALAPGARLGRLDDLEGRHAGRPPGMVISAFVYHLDAPGELIPQQSEVREAFWVPLRQLALPDRQVRRAFRGTGSFEFPGIVVGEPDRHVVWGLTYRFLEVFFRAIGRPFPDRCAEAADEVRDRLKQA